MKLEDGMITKTRRRYTETFKDEAVRLMRDSAQPVAQVARDLGIADHLLYRWRAEQRQAECQGHTRQSMRAEDNACVESFFSTLKRELIYHRQYRTRAEASQEIFEYIEVFYNRQRCHSTLGYQSPAEFEARTAVA